MPPKSKGRCEVCDGKGDHVHTVAFPDGALFEHVHDQPGKKKD